MKLNLQRVEPIGSHTSKAFVNRGSAGCTLQTTHGEDYPKSEKGDALRALRISENDPSPQAPFLSKGQAARVLGIEPSEYSELENGRYTLSDLEWEYAMDAIQKAMK